MAIKINYKRLDDGTWGAFIPASLGEVVIGEDIVVTKRNGEQNWHTVASIVTVYRSGTVVTLAKEDDEPKTTESNTVNVESELSTDTSKSNIFKVAHKLTKSTIQDGDAYSVNFGAALKYVLSVAKMVKAKIKSKQTFNKKSAMTRARIYDEIMNEGYSDAGNFNPYRNNYYA